MFPEIHVIAHVLQPAYKPGGIREPDRQNCTEILEAIRTCLEESVPEDSGDSAWLQLILLRSMEELLDEYRESFADAQIAQETVLEILGRIEEKAERLQVYRETLANLREQILTECAACREEIGYTYGNINKWKEAEKTREEEEKN